jgi:hypothetical protein
MRCSGLRGWRLFTMTILSLALLLGFPGTGKAVRPLKPPLYVPKAFRQLEASVAGLRFFATPTSDAVPMQARVYRTIFFTGDTRYIWWEMRLNTKAKLDHPVSLIVWINWQRADGTEFNQSIAFTLPPGLQNPFLSAGMQDQRPGGWLPGSYRVSIQIEDLEVARGSFDVLQKFFKQD